MSALLQVALYLSLGRLLMASGRLPREMPSAMTAWVLYFAWPAAALQSARSVRLDGALLSGIASLWGLFALAIVLVAIAIIVFHLQRRTGGAVLLAIGVGSTAGSLPFIESYCGAHCIPPAIVLSVLGGALAFSILGVAASCVISQGRVCVATIVRRVATFPPLIALVAGLLIPDALLPRFVQVAAHDLGATLSPIAIVAAGMHLRLPSRQRLAPIAAALTFKLALAPAAVLLGLLLSGSGVGSFGKLLVLLAAMPPLLSSVAIAREYQFEAELSGELAAFGASIALITMPLWGMALEQFA